LMPSEEESFGLAALEALACGVPVIGTLDTGLVEVIDSDKNGFLLPIGDTSAMADKAVELLCDKARLLSFKKSASERSKARFSSEKIIDEYEQYYREVLDA
ncbi:MAG: glycosyltransferase, partial [candidate division Zixibacteria bacterium]